MKPEIWPIILAILLCGACTKSNNSSQPPPPAVFPLPDEPIPEPRPEPTAGFQTLDTIEDSILLDLQNLGPSERLNSRYLVGCDRLNLGDDMSEFHQGINRGINQLSNERELFKTTAIGPGNCIYRIELDEIGWTKHDWDLLASNDILFFESNTVRAKNVRFLTQSARPYLYGSSAIVTAFEGDSIADKKGKVYYGLIRQDVNTVKFFAQQGVDRQALVNDQTAAYSGFSQSQIALGKSRMVAFFESRNGICMSTYDTAAGAGADDIFRNPFPVELTRAGQINGNVLSNKLFKHNAQEHICQNANGLMIYRLNNAADVAEVVAPANVVTNLIGSRIDSQIRIGDCGGCHYKTAAIPFRDQLNAHLLNNPAFNENEKNLAKIFFRYDRITAMIDQINRENLRALEDLGVTAADDPVWNVVMRPLREEMSIDQVASLLWMDTATFRDRLRGAAVSSQVFGNLVNGGSVSLAILSSNFGTLIKELAVYEDAEL